MKISEIKKHLATAATVNFKLPAGGRVPEHFHVTEIGLVTKHFIDCGGTERFEKLASFQLWNADDVEHRLKPGKLLKIIGISEKILGGEDLEIEVEYQSDTIGKYELGFDGADFELIPKQTACLAREACGAPAEKPKIRLSELTTKNASASCVPESGCC